MILIAKNIHKSYGKLEVLKGINLNIERGAFYTVVGSSGSGKTTLLQILGTLDNPTSGEVVINGKRVNTMTANVLSSFRCLHIGFVFQFHNLLPDFTAFENVCIPGYIARHDKKKVHRRSLELLELLGMSDRQDHKPSELSGGEQQRIAVARALINSPKIVLADEPSGNLDSQNATTLFELFKSLNNELKITFVVATHNERLSEMSDIVVRVKDGVIND